MPEPLMQGVFSIYETAGGGYHIAYRQDGSPEETHIDIPALVTRMARAVGAGKISVSREAAGHLPAGMSGEPVRTRRPSTATRGRGREDS